MTAKLTGIWRHPIKALSRERLDRVTLTAGAVVPFDRHWAVTHEKSRLGPGWSAKHNFLRGVTGPSLMAVTAELDAASRRVTLHHPDLASLVLYPDDADAGPNLCAWIEPIWPAEQPRPKGLAAAPGGFTDVPEPWISVNNLASNNAVADRLGVEELSIDRWRGNLWLDGVPAWGEFDWIGREISIGNTILHIRTRITRCKATMANPETGHRDHDTLAALRSWGHEDFGVYAVVIRGGDITLGDLARLP